jgi:hypothetical protein
MNPGGMIAEVTIEGIATSNRWTYNEEQLFRLAHFRSIDRSPSFRDRAQTADYFTIRVQGGGIAVQLPEPGEHIIVVGYLVDRQENVRLDDFNRRARGEEKLPDEILDSFQDLSERRSITEIVATRIQSIDHAERAAGSGRNGKGRRPRRRPSRRQSTPQMPAVEQEAAEAEPVTEAQAT